MKNFIKKTFGIIILGLFCLATHVNAQETDYMMTDETEDSNVHYAGENAHEYSTSPTTKIKKSEIKSEISSEGKSGSYPSHSASKSSTHTQPEKKGINESEVTDGGEDEDSVLSFNFLYYMIQKFKFSDVVDE